MTYQEFIDSILNSGRRRPNKRSDRCGDYDVHHIVPKCMGGADDADNLVYLTYIEHIKAHVLLFKENPNNSKLACAVLFMTNKCKDIKKLLEIVDDEEEFNSYIKDIEYAKVVVSEFRHNFKHTDESKVKTSESMKKYCKKHPRGGKNSSMWGKHQSDEAKRKQSEAHLGDKNPMKNRTGASNPHARAVICLETLQVFETLTEAHNKTGASASKICECCRGRREKAGKLHWMYYDEYLANETIDNQQGSSE